MNIRTKNFLKTKFREYFLLTSPEVPPGFESREWAFIHFDDLPDVVMRRHKSYMTRSELLDYVRAVAPAHIFHSAAYYRRPNAPTMKEKIWSGADLIFDLDGDHLRNAPKNYGGMLACVKRETQKLLNFLLDDFGFSEEDIVVVFSGGRGYHIHVRDPRVFGLGGDERREIVDYLTGRGLDIERFLSSRRVGGDFGVETADQLRIPPVDAPGWGGRISRSFLSFVTYLRELDCESAVEMLSSKKGIGGSSATKFYESLKSESALDQIRKGNVDLFKFSSKFWDKLIEEYLDDEGVRIGPEFRLSDLRGETDEPVTADVKRLIRFPMSLHGGSGLRVTPLSIDGLKIFDPLRDAVVFGEEPVLLEVTRPFRLELGSVTQNLKEGPAELPLFAAVFLMARGVAEMGKALDG